MTDETTPVNPPQEEGVPVAPPGPTAPDAMPNKFADQTIADAQAPYVQPRAPLSPPSPSMIPDALSSAYDDHTATTGEERTWLGHERRQSSTVDRRSGADRRLNAVERPKVPPSPEQIAEENEASLVLLDLMDKVREARNTVKSVELQLMRKLIASNWTYAKSGPEALKEARASMEELLGTSMTDFML